MAVNMPLSIQISTAHSARTRRMALDLNFLDRWETQAVERHIDPRGSIPGRGQVALPQHEDKRQEQAPDDRSARE